MWLSTGLWMAIRVYGPLDRHALQIIKQQALLSCYYGERAIPSDLGGLSHSHEDIAQLPGLVELQCLHLFQCTHLVLKYGQIIPLQILWEGKQKNNVKMP